MITRRIQSGFSLLELLVVVFIIGVLSAMLTLSVGLTGSDGDLETETDRLIAVLDVAREEAVMQGREFGMRFYSDGYEFATYQEDFVEYFDTEDAGEAGADDTDESKETDQSGWVVLSNEPLLGPRVLPEGILLELEIDGRSILLDRGGDRDDSKPADDEENEYRPQIFLFSSGDVSPFVLLMRRTFENKGVEIAFDTEGMVEITQDAG
jgi:general secretion pathway protein H